PSCRIHRNPTREYWNPTHIFGVTLGRAPPKSLSATPPDLHYERFDPASATSILRALGPLLIGVPAIRDRDEALVGPVATVTWLPSGVRPRCTRRSRDPPSR